MLEVAHPPAANTLDQLLAPLAVDMPDRPTQLRDRGVQLPPSRRRSRRCDAAISIASASIAARRLTGPISSRSRARRSSRRRAFSSASGERSAGGGAATPGVSTEAFSRIRSATVPQACLACARERRIRRAPRPRAPWPACAPSALRAAAARACRPSAVAARRAAAARLVPGFGSPAPRPHDFRRAGTATAAGPSLASRRLLRHRPRPPRVRRSLHPPLGFGGALRPSRPASAAIAASRAVTGGSLARRCPAAPRPPPPRRARACGQRRPGPLHRLAQHR